MSASGKKRSWHMPREHSSGVIGTLITIPPIHSIKSEPVSPKKKSKLMQHPSNTDGSDSKDAKLLKKKRICAKSRKAAARIVDTKMDASSEKNMSSTTNAVASAAFERVEPTECCDMPLDLSTKSKSNPWSSAHSCLQEAGSSTASSQSCADKSLPLEESSRHKAASSPEPLPSEESSRRKAASSPVCPYAATVYQDGSLTHSNSAATDLSSYIHVTSQALSEYISREGSRTSTPSVISEKGTLNDDEVASGKGSNSIGNEIAKKDAKESIFQRKIEKISNQLLRKASKAEAERRASTSTESASDKSSEASPVPTVATGGRSDNENNSSELDANKGVPAIALSDEGDYHHNSTYKSKLLTDSDTSGLDVPNKSCSSEPLDNAGMIAETAVANSSTADNAKDIDNLAKESVNNRNEEAKCNTVFEGSHADTSSDPGDAITESTNTSRKAREAVDNVDNDIADGKQSTGETQTMTAAEESAPSCSKQLESEDTVQSDHNGEVSVNINVDSTDLLEDPSALEKVDVTYANATRTHEDHISGMTTNNDQVESQTNGTDSEDSIPALETEGSEGEDTADQELKGGEQQNTEFTQNAQEPEENLLADEESQNSSDSDFSKSADQELKGGEQQNTEFTQNAQKEPEENLLADEESQNSSDSDFSKSSSQQEKQADIIRKGLSKLSNIIKKTIPLAQSGLGDGQSNMVEENVVASESQTEFSPDSIFVVSSGDQAEPHYYYCIDGEGSQNNILVQVPNVGEGTQMNLQAMHMRRNENESLQIDPSAESTPNDPNSVNIDNSEELQANYVDILGTDDEDGMKRMVSENATTAGDTDNPKANGGNSSPLVVKLDFHKHANMKNSRTTEIDVDVVGNDSNDGRDQCSVLKDSRLTEDAIIESEVPSASESVQYNKQTLMDSMLAKEGTSNDHSDNDVQKDNRDCIVQINTDPSSSTMPPANVNMNTVKNFIQDLVRRIPSKDVKLKLLADVHASVLKGGSKAAEYICPDEVNSNESNSVSSVGKKKHGIVLKEENGTSEITKVDSKKSIALLRAKAKNLHAKRKGLHSTEATSRRRAIVKKISNRTKQMQGSRAKRNLRKSTVTLHKEQINQDNSKTRRSKRSIKIKKEQIKKEQGLKAEKRTKAEKSKVFFCEVCNKDFSSSCNRDRHMKCHTGEQPFKCPTCKRRFSEKSNLKRHMQTHGEEKIITCTCEVCGKPFRNKSDMRKHMLVHTGGITPPCKEYFCKVCFKSFPETLKLERHMKNHAEECSFECQICKKSYPEEAHLKQHMKTHAGEEKIVPCGCKVCNKEFDKMSLLREHMYEEHRNDSVANLVFYCRTCLKTFPSPNKLERHMKSHSGERPFNCPTCDKAFTEKANLKRHMKTHTGEKMTAYVCDVCQKSFTDTSELKRHARVHTGEKPYPCDLCPKAFAERGHLKIHLRTHTGERPYVCTVCDKGFIESSNLKRHMRIHAGIKPYQCTVCQKAFSDSTSLGKHKFVHTGEKPHKCEICDRGFSGKVNLKLHMKTHTKVQDYHCHICGKDFAHSGSLQVHLRTHSGEKPHACEVCQKRFAEKTNLKRHMKIHTGEKNFECHVCQKTFRGAGNLKTHMRTHTGEKPYSCGICGKAFGDSSAMKRHTETHVGEKNHECQICDKRFLKIANLKKHVETHIIQIKISDTNHKGNRKKKRAAQIEDD